MTLVEMQVMDSHTLTSPEPQPPVPVPLGHVGIVELPGTNRRVWWTGRVAIGLRYERKAPQTPMAHSATWVQELFLSRGGHRAAAAA